MAFEDAETFMENDVLRIAGREFRSRLIVGTGKYKSFPEMARAHEASGAEIVTVAVRRVNLTDRTKESLLDYIDREKYFILPNTAGCYNGDEAIRAARLSREVGLSNWVKLEVIGDEKTLFPDNEALLDLNRRELAVVIPLVIGIVWLGLFPGPVLRRMEPATRRYVEAVQAGLAPTTARLDAPARAEENR